MPLLNIFSGKIIQALCWTLVHSLWLGLALTVTTGAIMLCTKKQSAAVRYNLLSAALLLFTVAAVAVFILQVTAAGSALNESVAGSSASAIIDASNNIQAFSITESKAGFSTKLVNFFNGNANIIVLFWVLVMLLRSIGFIGGLYKIKQARTTQLIPVGDHWSQRLVSLCAALKIKQPVAFFQSGIAKIPMVTGHLKPIILFPVGLLASLPAEEVEAVLLHELAHIRRKDYLVNMLQHFVEILFFFNPAILWVSSLIKIERENCCDDIAVAQSSSKRNYINALVSFQEYHLNTPQYATALAGNKKHLLQRVKRMLYNNNKTLNNMEKTFLTVCLVVAASLTVFFTPAGASQQTGKPATAVFTDTVPTLANRTFTAADIEEGASVSYTEKINGVSHTAYVFKRKGIVYQLYGDITSFKIDGKTIPQADWGKYKDLIAQLKSDYRKAHTTTTSETTQTATAAFAADEAKLQKDKLLVEQNQPLADAEKAIAEKKEVMYKQDKLQAEQDAQAAAIQKQQAENTNTNTNLLQQKLAAEKQQQDAEKLKRQAEKKKAEADALQQQQGTTSQSTRKRDIVRTVDDGTTITRSNLSYTENYTQAKPAAPVYTNTYGQPYTKTYKNYKLTGIQSDGNSVNKDLDIKTLTDNFIADLTKENVITGTNGLSYKMTADALIVNGKTQPESLHKKLKDKYIQSPDWRLLYNWSTAN